MFNNVMMVAAGGAIGAVIRYANGQIFVYFFGKSMPWATLLVNVLGCFLMGISYTWLMHHLQSSESLRLFVMVGMLGALTTWSTFSMETVLLITEGEYIKGFTYLLLTIILCFAAFFVGMKITS